MKNKIAYVGALILLSQFLFAQTIYYSKSTGNLNATATWGTNPNGTGTAPANFTTANCTYIIVNNTAPTISGNWTVSGANSILKVGDGTAAINFSVPSPRSVTAVITVQASSTLTVISGASLSSTVSVASNANLVLQNAAAGNPTFGTLSSGSTVAYSRAGNQTVVETAYSNLSLGGSGTKSLANATSSSVSGTLNIASGVIFRLNNSNSYTLTLSGTLTGSGTVRGGANSNLTISGSGAFGTLIFNAAAQSLYKFSVNRTSSGTVTLGSALTVANAFTHTNGIINLNGQTLTLNGTVTFPSSATNGSFSGSSTSSLSFGAGGASGAYTNSMYMTQSGTSNYLNNITLNNTSSPTLTLGNALNLIGALTPTAGTFASGGNLTLIASSYTNVARIGTIGASGNLTGNITVQMYAKGGTTGWTTMGSPGLTGRTFADWDDNITIQCLNCPDGYYYNFTSVQWYDETVGGVFGNAARYKVISNTTDPMTIGKGYWVYLGTSTSTTTDLILDATGPVNKGNYVFTITLTNSGGGTNAADHGYNLITNPYPSPINWTSLRNGNASIGTTFYVYNPDLSGYATYNSTGAVSNPAVGSGGIGNLIPAGQAFYVKASAATTLTALETYKSASTQALLRNGSNHHTTSTSNPMVLRLFADGASMHNETAMYFDAGATIAFEDEYDGAYMGVDSAKLGIATSIGGYDYSINGLPDLNQNLSIPVKVTTGVNGTYQISAHELQNLPGGACVILHDTYTNNDHDLRSGAYSCTISDTETVARFVLNITINNNLAVSGITNNPSCSSSANGFIIASTTGSAGPWNYYWKDANNNIIKTSLNKTGPDTLQNISGGNYSVDVNTVGSCDNGSQTFSLQGSQSPNSSFTPSATNVALVADTAAVSFANTSTNVSTFWWNFGDGNGSADTNALNVYTAPGIYTVTLTAYNTLCGDSSVSTQVIIIDSAAVVNGIVNNNVPDKNMFISKDVNGYYVQFNYKEKTNAVISVENVLGEKVLADIPEKNAQNQKVYIPLGNTENKILILSVVTEAGDKSFLKVVNQ